MAPNSATLSGLAFRRDAQTTDPIPVTPTRGPSQPWRMAQITLRLSSTSATPDNLSPDFSANTTGTPTTLFQGPWDFPAIAAPTALPEPTFGARFPFSTPFSFLTSSGNLLLDIQFGQSLGNSGGGFGSIPPYPVDAVSWNEPGWRGGFGPPGSFRSGRLGPGTNVESNPRGGPVRLTPGSSYNVGVFPATPSQSESVILWTGLSNRRFGAASLPLDLAPFGAPGNPLLVSPDLIAGARQTQFDFLFGWRAYFPIAIPNLPSLRGQTVYHQGAVVAPGENGLGLVTSSAHAVQFGARSGPVLTHAIASIPPFPIGFDLINVRGARGGPVVQLSGSFR